MADSTEEKDAGPSFRAGLIGFVMPPLGWLVWVSVGGRRPGLARSAGRGAIWGLLCCYLPAFLLYPAVFRARENVGKKSCMSNLKQVGLGILQYTQDYDERLPDLSSPELARVQLMPYLKSNQVFQCAATGQPYQVNPSLSRRSLAKLGDPARVIVYYDAQADHEEGRYALYLDGHVKFLKEADWEKQIMASQRLGSGG